MRSRPGRARPGDPRRDDPIGRPPGREGKVQARHLDRLAIVYVRQSSPQQVHEHRESGRLQYDLRSRAAALGWPADRVIVIDEDQGRSGKTAAGRPGFQRLLAEVGLDHVGLILGIEMSRLARSCRDWHQLLELCALFHTVLADRDALYDPTDHNDRLLLGLSGIMSEAELHILRGRMLAGARNKARRGELFNHAPIGYARVPGGGLMLDPDEQARDVVRLVFDKFDELGTVSALLRYLVRNGIRLGVRPHFGPDKGEPGVAAAEPDDADLPAAPPGLRRGVHPRPAADRPAAEGPRPPRHRPRGRAEGRVGGADPRPPARLHHVGALRVEPAAAGAERRPRRGHAGGPRGGLAAGRARVLRAVRAADDGRLHGQGGPPALQLPARRAGLRRAASARAWPGARSTSWWAGRCCWPWSRPRWS